MSSSSLGRPRTDNDSQTVGEMRRVRCVRAGNCDTRFVMTIAVEPFAQKCRVGNMSERDGFSVVTVWNPDGEGLYEPGVVYSSICNERERIRVHRNAIGSVATSAE